MMLPVLYFIWKIWCLGQILLENSRLCSLIWNHYTVCIFSKLSICSWCSLRKMSMCQNVSDIYMYQKKSIEMYWNIYQYVLIHDWVCIDTYWYVSIYVAILISIHFSKHVLIRIKKCIDTYWYVLIRINTY